MKGTKMKELSTFTHKPGRSSAIVSRRSWLAVGVALLASLALFAAACGSDDDDTAEPPTTTVAPTTTAAAATDSGDSGGTDSTDGDAADPPPTTASDEPAEAPEPPAETVSPFAGSPQDSTGFDGETIRLGYLTDQSGSLSIVGVPLQMGAEVYWEWVNSNGGVAGKYQVELVVGDTLDDPAQTITEYQRIKDDVVMFAEVLSTPPTQALLEFLREDNIIAVPGSLAGAWAGEAVLLPVGAAYEYEMINLVDWYASASGLASGSDVHCAIYVDDKYGNDSMRGVYYAAEQLGFELAEEQTISRGGTDFTAQVGALDDAGCTVVYTVTVPTEQNAILAQAESVGFEPYWLGSLPSYLNLFAAGGPDRYEKFYVALDSPNLNDTSVPGMADFLERFAAVLGEDANPNTFHLSGYFQSIAVHALLEKAVELGDLSREGMAAAMAQLGEVDTGGLSASNYVYGLPEDRVPTSAVRIYQFDRTQPPNFLTEVTIYDSSLNAAFDLVP